MNMSFQHLIRRKCLPFGCILVIIIIICLGILEHCGKRRWYNYRLTRYKKNQMRGFQSGPGENGTAVILSEEEQLIADKQLSEISYNVVAGNKIAMDRSLPDVRPKE